MKKIFLYAMALTLGGFVLTACSDDNDSNPTLVAPSEFHLLQPAVGNAPIDLSKSESINITWTIPNYTDFGAPVVPTYIVQLSPSGSFTKEFSSSADDNTGADYVTLSQTFNTNSADISAETIDQQLQQMLGWTAETDVPAVQAVYFRVMAYMKDAGGTQYFPTLSANSVSVNTIPYFILDRDPFLWYMVGNNIGTASWSNDNLGSGLIPLLPSADETYDKTSGTGVLSYVGYMAAGTQFKFVLNPGDWNTQLNYTNVDNPNGDLISDEDGDNHNIGIKNDGYYLIKINSKTQKVSVEAYTRAVKVFGTMGMPGDYNGWDIAANPMNACETLSGENHMWIAQFNPASDGGLKFAADGDWADNWGSDAFPWGTGQAGGANIPSVAGSYTVVFNDITGQYFFIAN